MLVICFHTKVQRPISTHVQYEAEPNGEKFKECVSDHSLAGIAASNPAECLDVFVYWDLYVARQKPLRRTDFSSSVILTVCVCVCVCVCVVECDQLLQ
jgi:hypothetical protein